MPRGNAQILAWGIAAAVAVSQLAWVAFLSLNLHRVPTSLADQLPIHVESLLLAASIPVVGALIVSRHSRHPVGWVLLIAGGSSVVDAVARIYATDGLYARPGVLPGPEYAAWVAEWLWFPAMAGMLTFLPLYFPDGRLPSPRWKPWPIGLAVWLTLTTIGYALYTRFFLRIYDPVILGFFTRVVWRCPTTLLVERYRRHIRPRHLDVGPGTGYFLERAGLPAGAPVTILDPNMNVLDHASRRLQRLDITAVEADVCKPLPLDGAFDSAALHGVIHCLPGRAPQPRGDCRRRPRPLARPCVRVMSSSDPWGVEWRTARTAHCRPPFRC